MEMGLGVCQHSVRPPHSLVTPHADCIGIPKSIHTHCPSEAFLKDANRIILALWLCFIKTEVQALLALEPLLLLRALRTRAKVVQNHILHPTDDGIHFGNNEC